MKPEKATYYYKNGSVSREVWYLDDKLHREDGPALICYREDGSVGSEEWRLNDQLHRTDGPARIFYFEDGSAENTYWWIDGERLEDL